MALGIHLLIEQLGEIAQLNDQALETVLCQSARIAGATILQSHFHHFGENCGYTGVVMLAESHISIHTWPEKNYAAIDIFMCGDCDTEKALNYLKTQFPNDIFTTSKIERQPPTLKQPHGDR